MPISVTCANGHQLRVKDEYAGRKVKCPKCQDIVEVAAASAVSEEPAEAITTKRAARQGEPSSESEARRPRRSGGWKLPVFLGGAAAVVAIGVLCYFLFFKPKEKETPRDPAKDRAAVEAVARRMVEVMDGDDREAVLALLTEKAQKKMRETPMFTPRPGSTYEVGSASVDGDSAEIPVTRKEAGKEEKGTLKLRREGEQWRIWGVVLHDQGITLNFERPEDLFGGAFQNPFEGKPQEADRAIEKLEGLSLEEFNRSWQDSVDVKDQPVGEVLQKLAGKQGLKLEKTAQQSEALAKSITLKLEGRSRWELIEEVCKQAGLYPVYPSSQTEFGKPAPEQKLVLKSLPRPWPVAFVGPFRVEIVELNENTPNATGVANLKVRAAGLPPTVSVMLEKEFNAAALTQVVDAQGRDLRDAGSGRMSMGFLGPLPAGTYERNLDLLLKNLLRDVAVIKTVEGRIHFSLPGKVESLRFDKLAPNTTQKAGQAEVTLKQIHQRDNVVINNKPQLYQEYEFGYKGIEPNSLKFVAHDAEGKLLGLLDGGSGGSGDQGTARVMAYKQPASITVKILSEMKPVEYVFKLQDVPLAADAKKPEKLEPATFPGHKAPVTLEFMKIVAQDNITKIQVQAVNHSDKDIRMLEMKFVYLDGGGKKLDEFANVNYTPPPMFPQKEALLVVAKNSTATFEVHAFFMPPGTKKVDITVSRVGFADATEWRPGAGPEK